LKRNWIKFRFIFGNWWRSSRKHTCVDHGMMFIKVVKRFGNNKAWHYDAMKKGLQMGTKHDYWWIVHLSTFPFLTIFQTSHLIITFAQIRWKSLLLVLKKIKEKNIISTFNIILFFETKNSAITIDLANNPWLWNVTKT